MFREELTDGNDAIIAVGGCWILHFCPVMCVLSVAQASLFPKYVKHNVTLQTSYLCRGKMYHLACVIFQLKTSGAHGVWGYFQLPGTTWYFLTSFHNVITPNIGFVEWLPHLSPPLKRVSLGTVTTKNHRKSKDFTDCARTRPFS